MESINKQNLAAKIRQLEGLSAEEKGELLRLLQQRRYGLIWEEKAETVETALQEQQPVLQEVSERALVCDDPTAPNHILIEGDNLHALTTLAYTHEGKIDMIYIDPPYNTGNKDFVYNDSFVDETDTFRHSKWLSFMAKRLRIARRLLSERGVIFISIGDDEVAQLKLLCDQIFEPIALVPRIAKKGSNQGTYFRPTKDYVLVCCKRKENVQPFTDVQLGVCVNEERAYKFTDPSSNRKYRKGHSLYQASLDPLRGCKNQRYYITAPDGTLIIPPGNIMPLAKEDAAYVVPKTKADKVWRWSYQSYLSKKDRLVFAKSKQSPLIDSNGNNTEWNVYEKKYQDEELDAAEKNPLPNDVIADFQNSLGTILLNEMGIAFPYSKPVELVEYLIEIIQASPTATVLDFFAGSGTTMHAVMQLNAEDGGHRQCILVTNNENGICENITYERNKRVIQGYTKPNGDPVEGLHHNNLRYYRTVFVPRESSVANKQRLMDLSTDLLCIQNDLYTEQPVFGSQRFRSSWLRYFEQGDRRMLVVYDTRALERLIPELEQMEVAKPILVYIFSLTDDPASADFETVQSKVQLCALPEAILRAYKEVLPPKRTPAI